MRYLIIIYFLVSCQPKEKLNFDLKTTSAEAEIFAPDIISTGLYERDLAFSPDGTELMYTLGNYDQSLRCLVQIKKEGDTWGEK